MSFIDKKSELDNCTFVKTVLMMVVVLYHSILFWGGNWFVGEPVYSAPVLSYLAKWFNSFHIYGFTLVSGYIFSYLRLERGKYTDWRALFLNKAKRLLIPYAFISAVWAIPVGAFFFKYSLRDVVKKFVFGVGPQQLWFLLMLFVVFAVFAFLLIFLQSITLSALLWLLCFTESVW